MEYVQIALVGPCSTPHEFRDLCVFPLIMIIGFAKVPSAFPQKRTVMVSLLLLVRPVTFREPFRATTAVGLCSMLNFFSSAFHIFDGVSLCCSTIALYLSKCSRVASLFRAFALVPDKGCGRTMLRLWFLFLKPVNQSSPGMPFLKRFAMFFLFTRIPVNRKQTIEEHGPCCMMNIQVRNVNCNSNFRQLSWDTKIASLYSILLS